MRESILPPTVSRLAIGVVLVAWFATPTWAEGPAKSLRPFEIEDQFGDKHSQEDYHGQIVIVIGSDKDGSRYNGAWGAAIDAALSDELGHDQVEYLPVADVRGVPFFLKGMIKGKFPKERDRWALVDWKGHFAKTYVFSPGESNILVFDHDGVLLHRAHGREVESGKLERIVAALQRALRASVSADP